MFGSSGIRGIVGEEIDASLALKIGKACGKLYGNIIIGNDPRTSSQMIKNAVIAGILSSGGSVKDAGLAPTPAVAYAARWYDAGIMVTASHNPPEYNGVKIFEKDGAGISMDKAEEIEKLIDGDIKEVGWAEQGELGKEDILKKYMDAILENVGGAKGRIIIDCSNGAASVVTPYILRKMGAGVISLNCHPDGFFPAHHPEPVGKNLQQLMTMAKEEKAYGIAHDCDADRMVVVSPHGEIIQSEKLAIVFANYMRASKIVMPINASMIVEEFFKGDVIKTRVGDIFVSEKLKEFDNAFGFEPSGTWTFPFFSYCPDGPLAAAKFAEMAEEIDVMEETAMLPSYPIRRESIRVRNRGEIMKKIRNEIEGMDFKKLIDIDGYRIEFDDAWILVRPSGTEPKIRITVEAREEKRMNNLMDKMVEMVKEAAT